MRAAPRAPSFDGATGVADGSPDDLLKQSLVDDGGRAEDRQADPDGSAGAATTGAEQVPYQGEVASTDVGQGGGGTAGTAPGGAPGAFSVRRYEWLSLPLLLTVAFWLARGQVELLLGELQQPGTQSYGPAVLGGGLWHTDPEAARNAIKLWRATPTTGHETVLFLWGETVCSLAALAAFTWLLWAAMRRTVTVPDRYAWPDAGPYHWYRRPLWGPTAQSVWRRPRPLSAMFLFGAGTLAARAAAFGSRGNAFYVWLAFALQKAEWLAFGLTALILAAAVRDAVTIPIGRPDPEPAVVALPRTLRLEVRKSIRHYLRAILVLRGQLALAAIWSALLLIDVTGQVSDLLRRWNDTATGAAIGIAATLLFGLLLWTSCERIILSESHVYPAMDTAQKSTMVFLVAAVVVSIPCGLVIWLLDLPMLAGLPIVLGILLILEAARAVTGWQAFAMFNERAENSAAASASTQLDGNRSSLEHTAGFCFGLVVSALGLALVRAGAGPVVLCALPRGYGLLPTATLVLIGLVIILIVGFLRMPMPAGRLLHHLLAAVALVLVLCMWKWPLGLPPLLGSVGVVAVSFGLFAAIFAGLQRFSELTVPPQGLTMIGLRRIPIFTLLGLWFLVSAAMPDGAYHRVRAIAAPAARTDLAATWEAWKAANCVGAGDSTAPVPLVMVAAEGGGIRAAYWTASVLTDLTAAPPSSPGQQTTSCPTRTALSHVFAISGISGGSVGAGAFLAEGGNATGNWYVDSLGSRDFASIPLATGLTVDLPRGLIGFRGVPDRAAFLERAWESKVAGFNQNYFDLLKPGPHAEQVTDSTIGSTATKTTWMPVTLFNGSQVETGCRVSTSALNLTSDPAGTDCRDRASHNSTLAITDQQTDLSYTVPAASLTTDLITRLTEAGCDKSVAVSTATLLSARWPYISPSGQLPCAGPRTSVVDGGYADGAGVQAALELRNQLAPLIARYNANPNTRQPVVPILVVIDNHYLSSASAVPAAPTPELLVPPETLSRSNSTRDVDRWEAAAAAFASVPGKPETHCSLAAASGGVVILAPTTRPGLPAPLAWTLAKSSRDDLDNQRHDLFNDPQQGEPARPEPGLHLRSALDGSQAGDALSCN